MTSTLQLRTLNFWKQDREYTEAIKNILPLLFRRRLAAPCGDFDGLLVRHSCTAKHEDVDLRISISSAP
jgi:hypothetical protein